MQEQDWSKLNNDLTAWTKDGKQALFNRIAQMAIGDYKRYGYRDYSSHRTRYYQLKASFSTPGEKSVATYSRKNFDVIDRISFRFLRHMVFVEKGVGRGMPIESVRNGNAEKYSRIAKPWFNPVIEKKLDELPAIVLAPYAGISLSKLQNALIK